MTDFDPFAGGEILRVGPTTGPQKEVIASAKMSDEANTAFNEAILIWIQGELDQSLLDNCLRTIIRRHDILRVGFSRNGKDICLYDERPFDLEFEDISSLDGTQQTQAIQKLKLDAAITPMNLEEGPLFHARLKKFCESRHALLLVAHHIICDGWSFGILLEELSALYRGKGSTAGLEDAPSFLDFAEQQDASQIANLDVDFWRAKFVDVPPTLDLPLDRKRPAMRTFTAARFDYELDVELVKATRTKAAELKASQMNLLLAAYFLLLHRLTSNQDIVVGIPTAGQASFSRLHQMGHLVQLLPIRISLNGDMQFSELISRVKSAVLDATEHPNFTFGRLLEKLVVDRTRVPLISTLFNIDQAIGEMDLGVAKATVETVPRTAENFELFLNLLPSADKLIIETTYSTALFSEGTIASWLQAFELLLREVIADPDRALAIFPLAKILPEVVVNANGKTLPIESTNLIEAFEKQVRLAPDADAIIAEGMTTSYAALEIHSNILRDEMLENGIGTGDFVGICVQRSSAMVASALAVLKTGASYLPLDPDFPESRLLFMIEDSNAVAVIEDSTTPGGIKELDVIHINPLLNQTDERPENIKLGEQHPIAPQEPAYRIYTSGSTGTPKGVTISHRSLINFLEVMAAQPGCKNDDRLLAVTTLSFDISVLELFLPLITGAVTIIASTNESKDGEKIAALIEQFEPTILQATPSTWKLLLASHWGQKQPLSANKLRAFCGGEPLSVAVADRILPRVAELWNLYGPTEATVWTTVKQISDTRTGISIGHPIANTQAFILDDSMNPLPISVAGELYIGGDGIAIGYHGRDELNAEKFVQHPEFGRLYRTGDLAKFWPNGEIDHLGRLDDQVKIRGYRVELGEIESALIKAEEVAEAAVYLWQLSDDDVRIVACCSPSPSSSISSVSIRKLLRSTLPAYMVPQYILEIDAIPHLPNGKVDSASLPKPEATASTILNKQALDTPLEKAIAAIWLELINTSTEISKDDNFFQLGGHSLLALEAIRRIEQLTRTRISTADIVSKSLSAIAADLSEDSLVAESAQSGPEALPLSAERALSYEQERIISKQLRSPENLIHNLPAAWLLDGDLDSDLLQKSLERVFERQTALRTIISGEKGSYRQTLFRVAEIDILEFIDCSDREDPESDALLLANGAASEPFEVLNKPLVRTILYRISSRRHLLLLVPHQLIFDGWSFDIFINDLTSTYCALLEGKPTKADLLPFEFRDFCAWNRERAVKESDRDYHLERLKQNSGNVQVLRDSQRKEIGQCLTTFTLEELLELESRCDSYGLRLHEYLYAAFAISLGEVLNQEKLILGVAVSGRLVPEVISLIGSFVSTLPCPIELNGGDFLSNSRSISEQFDKFQSHQDLSYAELFSTQNTDDELPSPNIQASIAFQDARHRSTQMSNLQLEQVDIDRKQIEYPIEFWSRIEADGFETIIDYDDSVIEKKEIELILEIMRVYITVDPSGPAPERLVDGRESTEPAEQQKGWRNLFR